MYAEDGLAELRALCPEAKRVQDGPLELVHLPTLLVTSDGRDTLVEGLLCLSAHSGYPTRLFLSQPFSAKPKDKPGAWQNAIVAGRTWHTWSWTNVRADQRPAQILAQHLLALR